MLANILMALGALGLLWLTIWLVCRWVAGAVVRFLDKRLENPIPYYEEKKHECWKGNGA